MVNVYYQTQRSRSCAITLQHHSRFFITEFFFPLLSRLFRSTASYLFLYYPFSYIPSRRWSERCRSFFCYLTSVVAVGGGCLQSTFSQGYQNNRWWRERERKRKEDRPLIGIETKRLQDNKSDISEKQKKKKKKKKSDQ